jgi:hypothetical protein
MPAFDCRHVLVYEHGNNANKKEEMLNPVALVRERTIPTKQPPLVDEDSANVLRIECATWSAWRIPTAVFVAF